MWLGETVFTAEGNTPYLGCIKALYNNGIKNKVKNVENPKPHTIEVATGPHNSECPPSPVASENKPAMVLKDVINIGTTRLRAANNVACLTVMPFLRCLLAVEIKTIAELTAMPARATTPYSVNRLSGLPFNNNPAVTPVNAMGTVNKINNG